MCQESKSVSMQQRNVQVLATLYKVINNLAPKIVHEIFYVDSQPRYNFR